MRRLHEPPRQQVIEDWRKHGTELREVPWGIGIDQIPDDHVVNYEATEGRPTEHQRVNVSSEKLAWAMAQLSPFERDILQLSEQGMSQKRIGLIFEGLTQAAVSYIKREALERLELHCQLPMVEVADIEALPGLNPRDKTALISFFKRTRLLDVCSALGLSPTSTHTVRYRLMRVVRNLEPSPVQTWFSQVLGRRAFFLKNSKRHSVLTRERKRNRKG